MKKLILGVSSLLVLGMSIVSCQKEKNEMTNGNLIHDKTLNYISDQGKIPTSKVKKRWRTILAADLRGAMIGAGSGAVIGTPIAGVGAAGGAVIGGIIGGAASSVEAANDFVVNNPDEGRVGSIKNIVKFYNIENKYDYCGQGHYYMVDEMFNNPTIFYRNGVVEMNRYKSFIFSDARNNYKNCDLLSNEIDNAEYLNYIKISGNNEAQIKNVITLANRDLKYKLSPDVFNILNDYCSALEATVVSTDFLTYSISVERSISNSNFEETDKALMLSFMSTARIGAGYYKN